MTIFINWLNPTSDVLR